MFEGEKISLPLLDYIKAHNITFSLDGNFTMVNYTGNEIE